MTELSKKPRSAYRQGDLVFIPLSKEDQKRLGICSQDESFPLWHQLDTNVLREGEATGHRHEVVAPSPGAVLVMAPAQRSMGNLPDMAPIGSEDRLLYATRPFEVAHPEHQTLNLFKGVILVMIQREYDETKNRRVLD